MTPGQGRKLLRSEEKDDTFFRFWMPFAFQRLAHSRRKWVYLPLNKQYKPLGVFNSRHNEVEYSDYLESNAVSFATDPRAFVGVWDHFDLNGDRLWLYSESPQSLATYTERLEKLLTYPVRTIGSKKK